MLVRLLGVLVGAWRFDEAFADDLFADAAVVLDDAARDGSP
jgi:hypothetical protein